MCFRLTVADLALEGDAPADDEVELLIEVEFEATGTAKKNPSNSPEDVAEPTDSQMLSTSIRRPTGHVILR